MRDRLVLLVCQWGSEAQLLLIFFGIRDENAWSWVAVSLFPRRSEAIIHNQNKSVPRPYSEPQSWLSNRAILNWWWICLFRIIYDCVGTWRDFMKQSRVQQSGNQGAAPGDHYYCLTRADLIYMLSREAVLVIGKGKERFFIIDAADSWSADDHVSKSKSIIITKLRRVVNTQEVETLMPQH